MESIDALSKELLEQGPSSKTVNVLLRRMKEKVSPGFIIKECIRWLKYYPDDVNLRWLLVEAYLEQGSISMADEEVANLIQKINQLNRVYKLQADILKRQGRYQEALDSVNIYLMHFPEDREAKDLIRELQRTLEVHEEPPKVVVEEEITEEVPEEEISQIATPKIAELYFEQGLIEDAVATYEKVIEQNPDDENSKIRLKELRDILEQRQRDHEAERLRAQKERTISILKDWLENIKKNMGTDVLREMV
jgi:tetratricopeptide (TPR) repeat protein